jgi:hypothetical protein
MLDPDGCLVRSGSQPARENGRDADPAGSRDRITERTSPDDHDDESPIVMVIRRWIDLYLDFGRLMGVAVRLGGFKGEAQQRD